VNAPAVTVPYLAATLVLAGAGGAKLARPSDTARALAVAGLPTGRTLVRVGAIGEIAVALAALVWSNRIGAVLVSIAYLGFALFVVAALRQGWPLTSCGCFGKADAKPTYLHAGLNIAAAGCAAAWAVDDPGSFRSVLSHQTWSGLGLAFTAIVVAGLSYAIWTRPPLEVGSA
jgi:hypothetical protein